MLHHSLVDSEGCTYVLHDGTHIHRNCGRRRHLATDHSIDELFLTSLRITLLQGNNFNLILRAIELLGTFLCEQFDGSGLIGLDANITLRHLGALHQELEAYENLVGMLHHQAIVGSDIGLTLYGVDDDTLGLSRRRRGELDKRGETGATHTNDTSVLDTIDNFLGGELRMSRHEFELIRAIDLIFPFIAIHSNIDSGLAIACGIDSGIDLGHCTTD